MTHPGPQPLYVTRPSLPPLEEFVPYLREIWDSGVLTNLGPMHQRLERALCDHLRVGHVCLFNNGTNALMTAVQALNLSGEVITTPYSFVATAHSLALNGIEPVFADIDPATLNLDPARIERAITPRTTAIMPVHCYGNPCDVAGIKRIADKHGLRVVYDAAHAFGVNDDAGSILRHGDLSVVSFHATKTFNTFEGGAIVCHDPETKRRIDRLKNFGIADETAVNDVGMNGKMSEFNAAFGLVQLNHLAENTRRRRDIALLYHEHLRDVAGIRIVNNPRQPKDNFSYFPVLVGSGFPVTRDELRERMNAGNIFPRRYFHPLISDFKPYEKLESSRPANLPVARAAAEGILCLPLYPDMGADDAMRVIHVIRSC